MTDIVEAAERARMAEVAKRTSSLVPFDELSPSEKAAQLADMQAALAAAALSTRPVSEGMVLHVAKALHTKAATLRPSVEPRWEYLPSDWQAAYMDTAGTAIAALLAAGDAPGPVLETTADDDWRVEALRIAGAAWANTKPSGQWEADLVSDILKLGRALLSRPAWRGMDARPLADWHEDMGPQLWWFFPVCEPPYAGTPLDSDWPGYHTHFTPIEVPSPPTEGGR